MRWFTDTAMLVRQRRVAEGRPDPADDPSGLRKLDRRCGAAGAPVPLAIPDPPRRGARLIAGKCAAPDATDTAAPRLRSESRRRSNL